MTLGSKGTDVTECGGLDRPRQWRRAPARPAASTDQVDVWRVDLDAEAQLAGILGAPLCDEERLRAAAFVQPRHGRRFACCRAALRTILGRYLDTPPADLRLVAGPHGKPALGGAAVTSGIRFSVSHADRLALIAIAHRREVGVDIELIRAGAHLRDIAQRFFGPADAKAILALPPEELPPAFFRCWCSQEACVKALGIGLAAIEDVRDDVTPPEGWLGASRRGSAWTDGFGRWAVADLDIDAGFAASLAVQGGGCRVAAFRYQSTVTPGVD